jgi:hypothetical protein
VPGANVVGIAAIDRLAAEPVPVMRNVPRPRPEGRRETVAGATDGNAGASGSAELSGEVATGKGQREMVCREAE